MVPNWDIHPEMISHTRVIDLSTGRPLPEISSATMENSFPQTRDQRRRIGRAIWPTRCASCTTATCRARESRHPVDLAAMSRENCPWPCNRRFATCTAPRSHTTSSTWPKVTESAAPRIEDVSDVDSSDPRLTVSIYAGTGDWFGGWDGDEIPQPDKYCNRDATAGRMVELIQRGEPAIMLCHWPGMYTHGTKAGFAALQQVVLALEEHMVERTIWMKLSEIARYWASRQLTRVTTIGRTNRAASPFRLPAVHASCPHSARADVPQVKRPLAQLDLRSVGSRGPHSTSGTCLLRIRHAPRSSVSIYPKAKRRSRL